MLTLPIAFLLMAVTNAEVTAKVRETAATFAKALAEDKLAASNKFLAADAIFHSPKGVGWEPQQIEVLDSGKLALVSGTKFNSIWRLELNGSWKAVLDYSCPTCQCPPFVATPGELQEQVRQTERGFAKSMADRDHAAFVSFLAKDAIFFAGAQPLRGADNVAKDWKAFYEGPQAPFSWDPDRIEVNASGTLALSSGPVKDPSGKRTGTFNSVWRREGNGQWKVVFDKGCRVCNCP